MQYNFPVKRSSMTIERALEVINSQSLSRSLVADDVFVFEMEISNGSIDHYYTRMTDKTLSNYAEDFNKGAPFHVVHNQEKLPMGRIFAAQKEGSVVNAFTYIQRNLNVEGQNTNDVIRGIEGGTFRDVSVGGKLSPDSKIICSVCGTDVLRGSCAHVPGSKHKGDVVFYDIDNARGVEGSLVGKGATPNANVKAIIRSYKETNGLLVPKDYKMDWKTLGALYGVDFEAVDEEKRETELNRAAQVATDKLAAQANQIADLTRKAALGDEFLKSLIDDAVAERVKAEGAGTFDETKYRETLNRLGDVDFTRSQIAGYKATAAKVLSSGVRPTTDATAGGTRQIKEPTAEDKKTAPRVNARNFR